MSDQTMSEAEAIATRKTVVANTFILEPLLYRGQVPIKNPPLAPACARNRRDVPLDSTLSRKFIAAEMLTGVR